MLHFLPAALPTESAPEPTAWRRLENLGARGRIRTGVRSRAMPAPTRCSLFARSSPSAWEENPNLRKISHLVVGCRPWAPDEASNPLRSRRREGRHSQVREPGPRLGRANNGCDCVAIRLTHEVSRTRLGSLFTRTARPRDFPGWAATQNQNSSLGREGNMGRIAERTRSRSGPGFRKTGLPTMSSLPRFAEV